jgi:hypothetical protein
MDRLRDSRFGIIIAGNGPEKTKLENFYKEKRVINIFFEGFQ